MSQELKVGTGDSKPCPGKGRPTGSQLLQSVKLSGGTTDAWLSQEPSDQEWDDFLRSSPLGHFQQSALWAQFKQIDGWQPVRVLLAQESRILGGFQLLCRGTRLGRVGYVIKGPVLGSEQPEAIDLLMDLLFEQINKNRLLAVVVQPPDSSRLLPPELARRGFVRDRLMNVISATSLVSLQGPPGTWERNLGRTRKWEVRRALRGGVTIREGAAKDAPKFFELMLATCTRQNASPNPGNEAALAHLIRVFESAGACRLSFAQCEGQSIACVLDLRFGSRVTTWKKGWEGSYAHLHPNSLLTYESLRCAAADGRQYLDYAGMDRSLAEALLAGNTLTEKQKKGRDTFILEFGAQPQLLPHAVIFWRNPIYRLCYRNAMAWPWLAGRLSGAAKRFGSA